MILRAMNRKAFAGLIIFGVYIISSQGLPEKKYRFCVESANNGSGSASKYCPFLDSADSPAVCVYASDRLECLRRLSTGKADFAILQAEEILVATKSSSPQILITDELRLWKDYKYEYQMAVIVRNNLNITGLSDLRGKRFCHPGFDLHHDWTEVTSNYFEMRVVPQHCESNLTILENHLKSSSEYFGAACKPGSWVGDPALDDKLKSKYRNLCELCDIPRQCSALDKYWGPKGALLCLSDEAGDIAWARLDDTLSHFGIDPDGPALAVPAEFSILCPNGYLEPLSPLTSRSPAPCSWMSRPWGVIAARSKMAQEIQKLVTSLDKAEYRTWQWALQYLLTHHSHSIVETETMLTPEDYLTKAEGFLSASGQFSCGATRSIKLCTPTLLEEAKCSWLREAASAHGLSPTVSCLGPEGEGGRNDDVNHCLESVAKGSADILVLDTQDQLLAKKFDLKTLVYEYSNKQSDYYIALLVAKADSNIYSLKDLKGKKACFTGYKDLGWNSFINALKIEGLLPPVCPHEKALSSFFSEACVPGLNSSLSADGSESNLKSLCNHKSDVKGKPLKHLKDERCCGKNPNSEADAFRCLVNGGGDVAVVEMETINKNTDTPDREPWAKYMSSKNYRILCVGKNDTKNCHIGWSPKGLVMYNKNLSSSRLEEIYTVFLQMDKVFGKRYKMPTPSFQLYGPFDGKNNVIFQDSTHSLVSYDLLKKVRPLSYNYEEILKNVSVCSSVSVITSASFLIVTALFLLSVCDCTCNM